MATELRILAVLSLLETTDALWNKGQLDVLNALMEKGRPDLLCSIPLGPTGYFIPSPSATRRIEQIIEQAEGLRSQNPQFVNLGIGLSEGNLMVECGWWGALSQSNHPPTGNANNDAWKVARTGDAYQAVLRRFPR